MFKVQVTTLRIGDRFFSDKYPFAGKEFVLIHTNPGDLDTKHYNKLCAVPVNAFFPCLLFFVNSDKVEVEEVNATHVIHAAAEILQKSYGKKDGVFGVRQHQLKFCKLPTKNAEEFNKAVGLLVDDTLSPAYGE
jgi:hypothetical protein